MSLETEEALNRIAASLEASIMTDRDRFAMAALQGDLAAESPDFLTTDDPKNDGVWVDQNRSMTREQKLAHNAYLIADAMIAARSK
jgi:hypothetical protein